MDSLGHQTPQAETKQSSITKQTSSWISRGQQDDRNQWISQTNQSTKFREEYYDFPQLPHAELQTIHFSLRTHPCANSPSSLAFLNISSINSLLTVEQRIEAKLTRISQRKYTPPTVPVASLGQPCTWNLVLMTSSGHTNVAATTPAPKPQITSNVPNPPPEMKKSPSVKVTSGGAGDGVTQEPAGGCGAVMVVVLRVRGRGR